MKSPVTLPWGRCLFQFFMKAARPKRPFSAWHEIEWLCPQGPSDERAFFLLYAAWFLQNGERTKLLRYFSKQAPGILPQGKQKEHILSGLWDVCCYAIFVYMCPILDLLFYFWRVNCWKMFAQLRYGRRWLITLHRRALPSWLQHNSLHDLSLFPKSDRGLHHVVFLSC